MVRLRLILKIMGAPPEYDVSIPLWCDCDEKSGRGGGHDMGFQSHYGAIATFVTKTTLVASVMFQSHYGAIATVQLTPRNVLGIVFQSHYGAIATFPAIAAHVTAYAVSIPLWCDCDSRWGRQLTVPRFTCFNPTMVRLRL